MNRTALISDDRMLAHAPPEGHPDSPARLAAILSDLRAAPVPGSSWVPARVATVEELSRVHGRAHIEALAAIGDAPAATPLDPDTWMCRDSWTAACVAAGAALQAVDEVAAGRADNAFALVRPPGHHAERGRAMGFCLFNNAALAAEAALRHHGVGRVAILDWDVHHGNGTQHLFQNRADVLYLSVHQYPFYPGTGAPEEVGSGAGVGATVNCALPAGQGDADYGAVFEDLFLPALARFSPELLIVSAGFDAHAHDPLGQMRVTERGFAAMCSAVASVGARGLVLLLEGGYDLSALPASVRACVEVMVGRRESFPGGEVSARCAEALRATRAAHRRVDSPTSVS